MKQKNQMFASNLKDSSVTKFKLQYE